MKKNLHEIQTPRRWLFLKTLDWYVLREFLIKFAVIMLLASILFITGDVFNDLKDFIGRDKVADPMLLATYFLLKLPGNIRFVLPISVLLGCMWTMAVFGKNHEVTAMRASGLSLYRCGGGILAAALVVTGINYYLNETFVPYAERAAEALKMAFTKGDGEVANDQRGLIFVSPDQKRQWFFELVDDNQVFTRVILKLREREPDSSNMAVVATLNVDQVTYSPQDGWEFHGVTRREHALKSGLAKPPERIEYLKIDGVTETPQDILDSLKDMKELPVWAIIRVLYKTQDMPEINKSNFWTILWYRLTFPISCFLAAFIGIPLAGRNERSGIMLAVIAAVVIIISYVVISEGFLIIGRRGLLNPFISGAAPTLAFLAYGVISIVRQKT